MHLINEIQGCLPHDLGDVVFSCEKCGRDVRFSGTIEYVENDGKMFFITGIECPCAVFYVLLGACRYTVPPIQMSDAPDQSRAWRLFAKRTFANVRKPPIFAPESIDQLRSLCLSMNKKEEV